MQLKDVCLLAGPLPNVERYNDYRLRGKNYAVSVLAAGGMGASQGRTVTGKLKAFFLLASGKSDMTDITVAQWEATWAALDAFAKAGPEVAVAAVEDFCSGKQVVAAADREQPHATLEIDGVEVDLTCPTAKPWAGSVEAWVQEVARANAEVTNIQFYFGDLLNQGIAAFGEAIAYARATAVSGRDAETLRFYAWVANKVPPARRVKELTFNHHRAVARLHPMSQATLLARAVEEELSVKDVLQIAAANTTPLTPDTAQTSRGIRCLVPVHIYRDLEQFAADFKFSIDDVVKLAVVKYMLDRRAAAKREVEAMNNSASQSELL